MTSGRRYLLGILILFSMTSQGVLGASPFTDEEINVPGISNLDTGTSPDSPPPPLGVQPQPTTGQGTTGQSSAKEVRTSLKLVEGYLAVGDLDAAVSRIKTLREQMKNARDLSQFDKWDADLAEKQVIVGVVSRIVSGLATLEAQAADLNTPTNKITPTLADLRHWIQTLRELAGNAYDPFLVTIQTRLDQIASSFTFRRDLLVMEKLISGNKWEEAERTLRHLKGLLAANPNLGPYANQIRVQEALVSRSLANEIKAGLARVAQLRQGGDARALADAIQATQKWILILERMNLPAYADLIAQARAQLGLASNTVNVNANQLNIPYFHQTDNKLNPQGSSQNTCIAMMLAAAGWKGSPDELTRWWETSKASHPIGGAELFNLYADRNKLPVRARGQIIKLDEYNRLLKEGKQMMVYGNFTPGHAVLVNGCDGKTCDVMDPAGKWDQRAGGAYDYKVSGAHQKYSMEAMEKAIVKNGEVWVVTFEKTR